MNYIKFLESQKLDALRELRDADTEKDRSYIRLKIMDIIDEIKYEEKELERQRYDKLRYNL